MTLEPACSPATDHVLVREPVRFDADGEPLETDFLDRRDLRAGHRVERPVVIGETDATTVVPPGFRAEVLEYGDIELTEATP